MGFYHLFICNADSIVIGHFVSSDDRTRGTLEYLMVFSNGNPITSIKSTTFIRVAR